MIRKYIDRTREIVEAALNRAETSLSDIFEIILAGGSTLILMVKLMVEGFFKDPYRASDIAKSVAMGAAIYNYLPHLPEREVTVC